MKLGDEARDSRESEFYAWVSFEMSSDLECVERTFDLHHPRGSHAAGMGKSPVGCEVGTPTGGWLVQSKIKEMSQPKRLISFQHRVTCKKASMRVERLRT
jgi:hypothetical protein